MSGPVLAANGKNEPAKAQHLELFAVFAGVAPGRVSSPLQLTRRLRVVPQTGRPLLFWCRVRLCWKGISVLMCRPPPSFSGNIDGMNCRGPTSLFVAVRLCATTFSVRGNSLPPGY